MWKSPTHGRIEFDDIPGLLLAFFETGAHDGRDYSIMIGSDSQNFDYTKSVTAIAMVCHGHGGIFFYEVSKGPLIRDVRSKLYAETQASLEAASNLISLLEADDSYTEMYDTCPISIHVDAGNSRHGRTLALIPEIVGWVRSLGYDCEVKPDSYVASSIADKISK